MVQHLVTIIIIIVLIFFLFLVLTLLRTLLLLFSSVFLLLLILIVFFLRFLLFALTLIKRTNKIRQGLVNIQTSRLVLGLETKTINNAIL